MTNLQGESMGTIIIGRGPMFTCNYRGEADLLSSFLSVLFRLVIGESKIRNVQI